MITAAFAPRAKQSNYSEDELGLYAGHCGILGLDPYSEEITLQRVKTAYQDDLFKLHIAPDKWKELLDLPAEMMPSDLSQIPFMENLQKWQAKAFDLITPAFRALREQLKKTSPGPRLPSSGEVGEMYKILVKGGACMRACTLDMLLEIKKDVHHSLEMQRRADEHYKRMDDMVKGFLGETDERDTRQEDQTFTRHSRMIAENGRILAQQRQVLDSLISLLQLEFGLDLSEVNRLGASQQALAINPESEAKCIPSASKSALFADMATVVGPLTPQTVAPEARVFPRPLPVAKFTQSEASPPTSITANTAHTIISTPTPM